MWQESTTASCGKLLLLLLFCLFRNIVFFLSSFSRGAHQICVENSIKFKSSCQTFYMHTCVNASVSGCNTFFTTIFVLLFFTSAVTVTPPLVRGCGGVPCVFGVSLIVLWILLRWKIYDNISSLPFPVPKGQRVPIFDQIKVFVGWHNKVRRRKKSGPSWKMNREERWILQLPHPLTAPP